MNSEYDKECPKCKDGQLWFFYEWTDDGLDMNFYAVEFDPTRRDCACVFEPHEISEMEMRISMALYERE
jgi:hypothetical protein